MTGAGPPRGAAAAPVDNQSAGEKIAVVSLACEFPGARSPEELWENVLACRSAFRRIPPERLNLAAYGDPDPHAPDRTYLTHAAVLEGYTFDRSAFRIPPETYRATDPAHWLALDVAARAIEAAGFPGGAGPPRETTAVIVGNSLTGDASRAASLRLRWPYVEGKVAAALAGEGWAPTDVARFLGELETSFKAPFPAPTEDTLAGGLANTIAGRIAGHFDLHGGAYTVDAACASSLLAVIQACDSLAAGRLDCAIAGGVDLSLDPFELVGFAKAGALARDEMRIFDANPTGFYPGEGCGMAVLMRLEDAQSAGMPVRAVIRGWGLSSDGAGGVTRPEEGGQRRALERAYARAGFGPGSVSYFEGHGTGTAVGDAVELAALSAVRRADDPGTPPAVIGSVKALIGHTKAAAGIAGLVKAILAVESGVVPETYGCRRPHELLARSDAALRVASSQELWPEGPRRAGVSAMGFGGVNTHVVVEAFEARSGPLRGPGTKSDRTLLPLSAGRQDVEVLVFAADSLDALEADSRATAAYAGALSPSELTDLAAALARKAATTAESRWRGAIVVGSVDEAARRLAALADTAGAGRSVMDTSGGIFLRSTTHRARIGLLFPGQGAPTGAAGAAITTDKAQPALVAATLAALHTLAETGVEADVAVGHSLGELVALHWAGALTEQGLVELAARRGEAMAGARVKVGSNGHAGAMAALGVPANIAAEIVATVADPCLVVAGENGPHQTVISGPTGAVAAAMRAARSRHVSATPLPVAHAFHSPLMSDARGPLAAALAATVFRPLEKTVVSTVTGGAVDAGADLPALLLDQLTAPVRFASALTVAAEDCTLLIEVGPGRALADLAGKLTPVPAVSMEAGSGSFRGVASVSAATFVCGATGAATLLGDRFSRPFSLDWQPSFLASPCEKPRGRRTAVVNANGHVAVRAAPRPPAAPAPPSAPVSQSGPRSPDGRPLDAAHVLIDLVARRLDVAPARVRAGDRFRSDLHLSSIAVAELLAEAARRLGVAPPANPTDFATASLQDAAEALANAQSEPAAGERIAGVTSWVQGFRAAWLPAGRMTSLPAAGTPSSGNGVARQLVAAAVEPWLVIGSEHAPALAPVLAAELAARCTGGGVAVLIPTEDDAAGVAAALAGMTMMAPGDLLVVVHHNRGPVAAFVRCLAQEGVRVCLVDAEADPALARAVAHEARAAGRFAEVRLRGGERFVPGLVPLWPEKGDRGVGPGDVVLVTGGAKGIGAEAAMALAKRGAAVALMGRGSSTESAVASFLERLDALGARYAYAAADVTSATDTARAMAALEDQLGPVTAVVHAAGRNVPIAAADLDAGEIERTIAPKVQGLRNVMSALAGRPPRILVTFGSVIARMGVAGEAHYALANALLRQETELVGRRHPECRALCVEWSVWAGVGMGARLGSIDRLARQGVDHLSVDEALGALDLLLGEGEEGSVVVAGRLGDTGHDSLPLGRFLEHPRAWTRGMELVADTTLSHASDPYLADHMLDGVAIVPGVMCLEAMAQAATAVAGWTEAPDFETVTFRGPLTVPAAGATLRVAALVRGADRVEVVLRSSQTGFAQDLVRAVATRRADAAGSEHDRSPAAGYRAAHTIEESGPALDADSLYGSLFFQSGRFRRIAALSQLSARTCTAALTPTRRHWFGPFLPSGLLCGDPGPRDAGLHMLQACVPHRRVLPVAVLSIRHSGGEIAAARGREHGTAGATGYLFDIDYLDASGQLVEQWRGVELARADKPSHGTGGVARIPVGLLGSLVERRVGELLGLTVEASISSAGAHEELRHRQDGKPEAAGGGHATRSYIRSLGLRLDVTAGESVGCDTQELEPDRAWPELLGPGRIALARAVAGAFGGDATIGAAVVWAGMEAATKAGWPRPPALTLESAGDDGWVLLRGARGVVAATVVDVEAGTPGEWRRLAVAIAGGVNAVV